jgi:hypothetical protein
VLSDFHLSPLRSALVALVVQATKAHKEIIPFFILILQQAADMAELKTLELPAVMAALAVVHLNMHQQLPAAQAFQVKVLRVVHLIIKPAAAVALVKLALMAFLMFPALVEMELVHL